MVLPRGYGIARGWPLAPGQVGASPPPAPGSFKLQAAPVTACVQLDAYAEFVINPTGEFTGPLSYSLASGALPHGMFIDPYSGSPFGEPWSVGAYPGIVIRATDTQGQTADLSAFQITVTAAGTLVHNTAELTDALAALGGDGGVITLAADGDYLTTPVPTLTQTPGDWLELRGSRHAFGEQPNLKGVTLNNTNRIRLRFLDLGDDASVSGACVAATVTSGAKATNTEILYCEGYGQYIDPNLEDAYYQREAGENFCTERRFVNGRFENLTVVGVYAHDLNAVIKASNGVSGAFHYEDITGRRLYDDFIQINVAASVTTSGVIRNVFATEFFGKGSDKPDNNGPHCDVVQPILSGTGICRNIVIEGVVYVEGENVRGQAQSLYASADATAVWRYMQVRDCLFILKNQEEHSPDMSGQSAAFVSRLRAVRMIPGAGTGVIISKTATQSGGMRCAIVDSIGETISGTGLQYRDNPPPLANTKEAYQAAFEGDFDGELPSTREGWVARYRPRAEGPYAALRDVYDYSKGVTLVPHRVWAPLEDQLALEVSQVVETGLLPVFGGEAGQALVPVAGTAWRKAADDAGTGLTPYSTADGTIDPGEFVEFKATAPASPSATSAFGATIGGAVVSKNLSTAADTEFETVDNNSSAYSTYSSSPGSAPGQNKLVVVMRAKLDATGLSQSLLAQGTNGTMFELSALSTGSYEVRLVSNSALRARTVTGLDTGWHTHFIAIDTTMATLAEALTWYVDSEPATITSVAYGGAFVFNPQTAFALLTTFARSGGVQLANAQMQMHWIDWSADGALPDFSDPAIRDLFTADHIDLADGSGPTGVQPKFFNTASAGAMNAGTGPANKGSVAANLNKAAGTYV